MTMTADQLERAACRGKPRAWWMPKIDATQRRNITAWRHAASIAIRICDQCPVNAACLREAIDTCEREAIRGGLTPPELAQLSRRTNPRRHGTESCYHAGCRLPECTAAHAEYNRLARKR